MRRIFSVGRVLVLDNPPEAEEEEERRRMMRKTRRRRRRRRIFNACRVLVLDKPRQVLALVLPDGHHVGVVQQDV